MLGSVGTDVFERRPRVGGRDDRHVEGAGVMQPKVAQKVAQTHRTNASVLVAQAFELDEQA
jgi:hypothetical protein